MPVCYGKCVKRSHFFFMLTVIARALGICHIVCASIGTMISGLKIRKLVVVSIRGSMWL